MQKARPKLDRAFGWKTRRQSYHAKQRVTDNDLFDYRLIFGDNLLALKALEAKITGKVKYVFLDSPFKTGTLQITPGRSAPSPGSTLGLKPMPL